MQAELKPKLVISQSANANQAPFCRKRCAKNVQLSFIPQQELAVKMITEQLKWMRTSNTEGKHNRYGT